jgi:hypothetical protein
VSACFGHVNEWWELIVVLLAIAVVFLAVGIQIGNWEQARFAARTEEQG